jgi:hypothetical protein
MNCLLISGFRDTGKSTTMVRLGHFLLARGYTVIQDGPIPIPTGRDDFNAVLEDQARGKRVLLYTRSDYPEDGDKLVQYYRRQTNIDVLITTIRDAGRERDGMWNAIVTLNPINTEEVPMARVTRRSDRVLATPAYLNRVENICRFILAGQPFGL